MDIDAISRPGTAQDRSSVWGGTHLYAHPCLSWEQHRPVGRWPWFALICNFRQAGKPTIFGQIIILHPPISFKTFPLQFPETIWRYLKVPSKKCHPTIPGAPVPHQLCRWEPLPSPPFARPPLNVPNLGTDAPRRGPCRRACGVHKEVAAAAFFFLCSFRSELTCRPGSALESKVERLIHRPVALLLLLLLLLPLIIISAGPLQTFPSETIESEDT